MIEEHGILLQSARGPLPNIPELVVGEPIRGSWWGHPDHDEIFKVLNQAMIPGEVIRMKLISGKVTLVHRRLWPAIVKLADRFAPEQLAVIDEEHTRTGLHSKTLRPFPEWVPDDVLAEAGRLTIAEAEAQLPEGALSQRALMVRSRIRRAGAIACQDGLLARLKQIVIDCQHPAGLARFWSQALNGFEIRAYDDAEIARLAALGYTPETDPVVLVDGPHLEICFQQIGPPGVEQKRRLHLDIEADDLHTEVARLGTLGAEVVERFDDHVWMRDPELRLLRDHGPTPLTTPPGTTRLELHDGGAFHRRGTARPLALGIAAQAAEQGTSPPGHTGSRTHMFE